MMVVGAGQQGACLTIMGKSPQKTAQLFYRPNARRLLPPHRDHESDFLPHLWRGLRDSNLRRLRDRTRSIQEAWGDMRRVEKAVDEEGGRRTSSG